MESSNVIFDENMPKALDDRIEENQTQTFEKQTILAISTTEAEYVATRKACLKDLWMKQAMKDYDIYCEDALVLFDNKVSKHGASSSRRSQLDPKERIKVQINKWLDEDTWIGDEDEISLDEVVEKEAIEKLSFGEKMAYKSYLTSKCQHRESRTKIEIMKNFLKKWVTTMSCKYI
ncbi:hypothetical protein Tco_0969348 [Tanacetum coccineum]